MKCFLILAILFTVMSGASAQSIHTLPAGSEFESKVKFARSEMPLPPGKWKLVAGGEEFSVALGGQQRSRLAFAHLAQIEANRLVALVSLFGTQQANHSAWTRDANCDRTDLVLALADRNFNTQDQWCLNVMHQYRTWVASDGASARTSTLYAALNNAGIVRPPVMLETNVRIVRHGEFVLATYGVLPSAFGGPVTQKLVFATSEWHAQNLANYPKHREFSDAWIAWSKPMLETVRSGFNGTLANYDPMPYPFAPRAAKSPEVAASRSFMAPAVGIRIETAGGSFTITHVEGMKIHTVNGSGQSAVWQPGGLLPLGARAQFDRNAAESIFPLAVGKKTSFEQTTEGGADRWAQSLEVVGTETLQVGGEAVETFVVTNRTESLNPAQGGIVRIRTLWFAPKVGWLLKVQSEQLSGPPMQLNDWYAVRVVPPS